MARCAHVSHVTSIFFPCYSPPPAPEDRTSAIVKSASKTQRRIPPRVRNQIRETLRVSTRQKSVFQETMTYNFVRIKRETKKETKERKRKTEDNNNLMRQKTNIDFVHLKNVKNSFSYTLYIIYVYTHIHNVQKTRALGPNIRHMFII